MATPETDEGAEGAGPGARFGSWPMSPAPQPRRSRILFVRSATRPALRPLQRRPPHPDRTVPGRTLRRDAHHFGGAANRCPSTGRLPGTSALRRPDRHRQLIDSATSARAARTSWSCTSLCTRRRHGRDHGLAGELERDGLIDCETVRRMACDATIAVAIDDEAGHTMYEGRALRFPTDAQRREVMRRDRHCRFPGCTNVTFTNVHHVVPWEPGGRTDLDNLALRACITIASSTAMAGRCRATPTRNCMSSVPRTWS